MSVQIRFLGFPHTDSYCGPLCCDRRHKGDTRGMSDADADELIAEFPAAFEIVRPSKPAKSKAKRKAKAKDKSSEG